MNRKQKTIAQLAQERTFEDIFNEQNKLKIQKQTIERDITELVQQRNALESKINKLSRIASIKRRAIVDKK